MKIGMSIESVNASLTCTGCGSTALRNRGSIPSASEFAGQALDPPLRGGRLLACRSCGYCFRDPLHAPAFYDALYAQAEAGEWESDEPRIDHARIAAALRRHCAQGDVLDIGCGTGALMAMLPPAYRRHGVEIGERARAVALGRSIELVGRSFFALQQIDRRFDAVLAADVIEHHPRPVDFVSQVFGLLKPGGLLILSTGNANATLWRLCGGRFWYCQFAEHLSFVSPRWLALQAKRVGELVEIEHFAYAALSLRRRVKLAGLLLFYMVAPSRYSLALAKRRGWKGPLPYHAPPPGNGLTRDHIVAVLRKPS